MKMIEAHYEITRTKIFHINLNKLNINEIKIDLKERLIQKIIILIVINFLNIIL